MSSPFGPERDLFFMRQALVLARKALEQDEVPIGALVVNQQGDIIGRGYNKVEKKHTQSSHAEIIALAKAGAKHGDWRLNGCWVYVTLEPCGMCMHLIRLSRCAGLVFGADSPLYGYQVVDKSAHNQLYKENVVKIEAGLCAQESAWLLKGFFKAQRIKKKEGL